MIPLRAPESTASSWKDCIEMMTHEVTDITQVHPCYICFASTSIKNEVCTECRDTVNQAVAELSEEDKD